MSPDPPIIKPFILGELLFFSMIVNVIKKFRYRELPKEKGVLCTVKIPIKNAGSCRDTGLTVPKPYVSLYLPSLVFEVKPKLALQPLSLKFLPWNAYCGK